MMHRRHLFVIMFAQGKAFWIVCIFTFSMKIAIIRCSFYWRRFCLYYHHSHTFWSIKQYSQEKSCRHLKQVFFPLLPNKSTVHLSSTSLHAKGTEADHNNLQVTQETEFLPQTLKWDVFLIYLSPRCEAPPQWPSASTWPQSKREDP